MNLKFKQGGRGPKPENFAEFLYVWCLKVMFFNFIQVYALNESLLIIDQFTFDGQGAGVFINIATEGNSRGQWIANRKIVDYPSSLDARPIERPYLGERLFIQARNF